MSAPSAFPRLLALALALGAALPVQATRFTYHGELLDGEAPADGRYDLRLRAFAQPGSRIPLAEATELPGVTVMDGRFSVELELPEDPDGTTWIEVAVRDARSEDGYVALGAPQPLSKVNGSCPGSWAQDGNTGVPIGSFLGIADAASTQALVLRARATNVARFVPAGSPSDFGDAPAVALGSSANVVGGTGATVGGGGATRDGAGAACATCRNQASGTFATVAGGRGNTASGTNGSIGGGWDNVASGLHATVPGGVVNQATDTAAVVAGGSFNHASATGSTIAGGHNNQADGAYAAVLGGQNNIAVGNASVVPGGTNACAGGTLSFAAGFRAIVRSGSDDVVDCQAVAPDGDGDEGSFVWADFQQSDFVTTGPNQFLVRARGGVGVNAAPPDGSVELTITSDADGGDYASLWLRQKAASGAGTMISTGDATGPNSAALYVDHYNGSLQARRLALNADGSVEIRSNTTQGASGVRLNAGDSGWVVLSDRRAKTGFEPIDPESILARLLELPISRWSYREGGGVRHLGPMAQDFFAAFALGHDDVSINTIDADGVALAAIQGLNARLERENGALRRALAELAAEQRGLAAQLERLLEARAAP